MQFTTQGMNKAGCDMKLCQHLTASLFQPCCEFFSRFPDFIQAYVGEVAPVYTIHQISPVVPGELQCIQEAHQSAL